MRKKIIFIVGLIFIQGCATSVRPFDETYEKGTGASKCSGEGLVLTVCQLEKKSNETLNQSLEMKNNSDWFNVPLIAGAATIGGLLLFGGDDVAGLSNGTKDTIAGIGLGAATLSAYNSYFSPSQARETLRRASTGYRCMATHGAIVEKLGLSVIIEKKQSSQKANLLTALRTLNRLLKTPESFTNPAEAKGIAENAQKALELYNKQERAADMSDYLLKDAAWSFGIDLLRATDRKDVNFDDLVKSISDAAKSNVSFDKDKEGLEGGSSLAKSLDKNSSKEGDNAAEAVETAYHILTSGLVNVEAITLGFKQCSSIAITGGKPPLVDIQTVSVSAD